MSPTEQFIKGMLSALSDKELESVSAYIFVLIRERDEADRQGTPITNNNNPTGA